MLSKKELVFLSCLRNSARKNLTSIAKEVGVPVSTLFEKLKKLEKSKIVRHTSLLNFNELGYSTRAKILIKAHKKDREALKNYLTKSEYVNSVFKITNGYDFLIEGVFTSMKELEHFGEILEERFDITSKTVYFVVDDIKREKFLADKEITKSFNK